MFVIVKLFLNRWKYYWNEKDKTWEGLLCNATKYSGSEVLGPTKELSAKFPLDTIDHQKISKFKITT